MQFRYSMTPLAARSSLRPSPFRKIWQLIFQRTGLACGLNRLVEALLKTPEPKVVWKSDPETKASHYFTSEQEALIWLERRFQQFL
jgi:hypothetical protein